MNGAKKEAPEQKKRSSRGHDLLEEKKLGCCRFVYCFAPTKEGGGGADASVFLISAAARKREFFVCCLLFLSLSRRLVVFFSLPRERNFFSTPLTNNSSHAFLLNLFAMARFLAFVYALAVAVVLSASPISASSRCVWCFRWLREGERER